MICFKNRAVPRKGGAHDGFTFVDVIVGTAIFTLIGIVVFMAYTNLSKIVRVSSERVAANALLQQEIETIRNIPFSNLGLEDSVPNGTLQPFKNVTVNGKSYEIRTIVRNVDDPFDGVIGTNLEDVRFPFSAQVGEGGLTLENQATVFGKVFSNGDIQGDNQSIVTEDVWAANGSTINTVFTQGDAHANTIINSVIDGDAYYQSISGSTVGGQLHPGSPDTPLQDFPISDATILGWKNEAEAVSSIGPVSVGNGETLTLGPAKINGDLTIIGSGELIVTGTLWVTGDIDLRNTASIYLDDIYSSASGVIISDGKISIDNNTASCGSEGYNNQKNQCNPFAGSYAVFISDDTSLLESNPAIKIKNSTGFRGILYTNDGLISIENGAEVVEATGYAVRIYNQGAVTYGTGIFNLLITGNPQIGDTSPGDYKLVEVRVRCTDCLFNTELRATTTVAPKLLETTEGNGAILVQVFDAVGQPVVDADVMITNTTTDPLISITDVTDAQGRFLAIGVPPAEQSYEIVVTKDGYSTDQTYAFGDPSNPSPLKPHATVIEDAITQVSFAIDELSALKISTVNPQCGPQGTIDFDFEGTKLIGQTPDVLKYSQSFSTSPLGGLTLTDMEWDTYTATVTDTQYFLGGSLPSMPMQLSPNTAETLIMVMQPITTNALLVEVIDAVTQQPVEGADVYVATASYAQTLQTGEGHWSQTDWSGGSGQTDWTDPTRYQLANSVAIDDPAGDLTLEWTGTSYASSGWLESSSFDNATSTNFYHLVARPENQPLETGTDPIRIQVASNSDNATWNFIGPDGTSGTYYTPSDHTLHSSHNGDRYIRYRVELYTEDTAYTPNLSDIAISFANECTPSGQVYFNDIVPESGQITVSKTGYDTNVVNTTLVPGWQSATIELTPQ